MIRIGTALVAYTDWGCETIYEDGASYGAHPHDNPHYHLIAARCGYDGDLLAYAREHEVAHHVMSEWAQGVTSRVLWPLAHGAEPIPAEAMLEELAAMAFQRWLRANERPIIGGVDWGGLKARALAILPA